MSDNEMRDNLINAISELIEIAQQEMSGEWSREYIEKKLSKYTSLLEEIEDLKNDKGESYQICVKENDKITKIWGYEI